MDRHETIAHTIDLADAAIDGGDMHAAADLIALSWRVSKNNQALACDFGRIAAECRARAVRIERLATDIAAFASSLRPKARREEHV